MASSSLARADRFSPNEAPTARFPKRLDAVPMSKFERGSGVRPRVTMPDPDEVDRMAAFASLYASMRLELDTVIDPTRVPVLVAAPAIETHRLDAASQKVLRVINGVSPVADICELSGLDKAHAIAILCTLATLGAVTLY